ncbi:TonB-dependent receptor [Pseudoalteromonas sp. MMG010]|uniref:TonB-dependent receptor plug domain-containing protein n=1 Tax=Pseudoalteromonas sp. MMG010 TaxID=2822685 RepID=UPI001B3A06BF|nr:TonB-dependent receptor [Pseudoalteromonas sp. MMG010]MBQ4833214.1 TonB-dependent receptor [Pseudoalteromonas sp. MMG010]
MNRATHFILPTLLCSISSIAYSAEQQSNTETPIETMTVHVSPTANTLPVGTFDSLVSNLEYDPRVDLQSRNMAEAQADITIRGGIFENTGFIIGSATLLDPQTGHYVSEIPIAPSMLTAPKILTGADNALAGMNSAVGSVAFNWRPITGGGSVSLGVGNNDFNLQSINASTVFKPTEYDYRLGVEGEYSHSQSDGSIDNGDHDFERIAGRIQLIDENSQTDLFFGSQNKFFGWPNLYTPFGVNETEDLETRLIMLNYKQHYANDSFFELSAYNRKHEDHYVYSRENPAIFEAFHQTKVNAIGLSGQHNVNPQWAINYSTQFLADSIESTSLENNFTSRDYYKISVLPQYSVDLNAEQQLVLRLGASFDDTNRDDSQLSLIGDISFTSQHKDAGAHRVYLSYAQASQVAGYTAIGGSETGGLFRSNHNLQRETSQNLELGIELEHASWQLNSALFYRKDDNLTDWTYNFDSTSARFANPVDINTTGVELVAVKHFDNAEVIASYTHLHKAEDYGAEDIDASFYALNFPTHRLTLGVVWQPIGLLEFKIDNEWRSQQHNNLRSGGDNALFTHISLKITPPQISNVFITLAGDNVWDESFQEIPGTPGRGEQYTLSATYSW